MNSKYEMKNVNVYLMCACFCLAVVLSKEDKEVQRQRQLKQIKLKYGLKVSLGVHMCLMNIFKSHENLTL